MANEYRDFNHAMMGKYGVGFITKLNEEEREEFNRLKAENQEKRDYINRKISRYYREKKENMSNEAKLYTQPDHLRATESYRGIHKVKK